MRESQQQPLKGRSIDLIIHLAEKEREYQQALSSGKMFDDLKKLREQIRELQNRVETNNHN